jgi:hypothetical protein
MPRNDSKHMSIAATSNQRAYFAYGINMDRDEMAYRCPRATLRGTATLDGYRFMINREGVATLVPTARSLVYGVLWNLTPVDEVALDLFEGVDEGFYEKQVILAGQNGREYAALIYLSSDSTPGRPRPGYWETVCDAARSHRFPATYVAKLVALSAGT